MKWGISIKKLRNEMKLSQADFARELGVSSSSIGRWERGKNEPNAKAISVLTKLCNQHRIPFRDEDDLFLDCLERLKDHPLMVRALTDCSRNNYLGKRHMPSVPNNVELATYGDAVLKLAFCDVLYDSVDHLTIGKEKYESDKNYVEVIGKRYDILRRMKYDSEDYYMPKTYIMHKKDMNHKRIATCVEAIAAAIFLIDRDIEEIIEIARFWKKITDEALTQKNGKE